MAQVREWELEKEVIEDRIKTDQEKLAVVQRKLDAANTLIRLMGFDQSEGSEPEPPEPPDAASITAAVLSAINSHQNGATPQEIRGALENSQFRSQILANPNYLYTVIHRLAQRGRIMKRGNGSYVPV
jgi:hypothetical protein